MMKKFMTVLLLVVGLLIPLGGGAQSAHAEDDPSVQACGDWQNRSKTMNMTVQLPPGTADGSWTVTATLRFQRCNSGASANISYYKLDFNKVSGPSCGPDWDGTGGNHTHWRANPNVLGQWNPGQKEEPCSSSTTIFWGAPQGTRVYAHQLENVRCIGAHLTAVQYLFNDTEKNMESICIL